MSAEDEYKRMTWKEHWREHPPKPEKVNWNYYVCRGCNRNGDAHMISLQARLELCNECYFELPKAWRRKRGENPSIQDTSNQAEAKP
jgi:hypothetical protein